MLNLVMRKKLEGLITGEHIYKLVFVQIINIGAYTKFELSLTRRATAWLLALGNQCTACHNINPF